MLIGYLHQVCLHWRVVLLTEELDEETERLLADPTLFPGIVGRIRINQYDGAGEGLMARNRRMSRLAREIVDTWRPSVVFASGGDLFEHYLRRYAKQACGAINISCSGVSLMRHMRDSILLYNLHSAETRFPAWLPRSVRRAFARAWRQIAQFVYYVVVPLTAGQRPFLGVNGIYQIDETRFGNMDIAIVFTRDNQEMLMRDGAPTGRVLVVPYPIKPGAADPIWRALSIYPSTSRYWPKVLTSFFLIQRNFAFRRDNYTLIPDNPLYASRVSVIKALLAMLPGWEIRIKPHPMSAASPIYEDIRRTITALSNRIVWVPPDDPADRHIAASGAVVCFPPASTTIFSAITQRPGIPALMVDINRELMGDGCLGLHGVVTIDSLRELNDRLATLAAGTWRGSSYHHDVGDFDTLNDLIIALLARPESCTDANP